MVEAIDLTRFNPHPVTVDNLVRFDLYDPPLLAMDDELYLHALEGSEPDGELDMDWEEEVDPAWEGLLALKEYDDLRGYEEECLREITRECLVTNLVHIRCDYRNFLSRSKGRSRGRNRRPSAKPRRRFAPKEVELISTDYGRSYHEYHDGYGHGFDEVAQEIYGDTVAPDQLEAILLRDLRSLPRFRSSLTSIH